MPTNIPTDISINSSELFGTQAVSLYNTANEAALGIGFTILGILVLCYILAVVLKPFFYLLFTIKLAYQGIRETLHLIKGFFKGIYSFFKFIHNETKEYFEKRPHLKFKLMRYKVRLNRWFDNITGEIEDNNKRQLISQ